MNPGRDCAAIEEYACPSPKGGKVVLTLRSLVRRIVREMSSTLQALLPEDRLSTPWAFEIKMVWVDLVGVDEPAGPVKRLIHLATSGSPSARPA